jgi:hypothetical protein
MKNIETTLRNVGTVSLVGAGPGDPELLTIKAVKAIAAATVLLVDDLVSPAIVALAPPGARVIHVGKRGGCKSTPQAFIEKLMVMAAREGETVVRLKGGDPFIFGRGGEEVEHLRAQGITVQVINGRRRRRRPVLRRRQAGQRGRPALKVLLIDHTASGVAEKIRISGGGRCNFTNRDLDPPRRTSTSSATTRISAARRCRATRRRTSSRWCSATASPFTKSTRASCLPTARPRTSSRCCWPNARPWAVTRWQPCSVKNIGFSATSQRETVTSSYQIDTDRGTVECAAVVVATGGLSIPKIGATDFGYRVASSSGLPWSSAPGPGAADL